MGRISLDLNDNRYYLELNGASYELVSPDGTTYYTMPDQHFKITRAGNQWDLYDTSGNHFRFGGTSDSQQYIGGTSGTYYRWDLSLMGDTNDNEATVTYSRDIQNNSVRAAYPATLSYGSAQIIFNTGSDETDQTDGDLRFDNPKSTAALPAPVVMETRRLDSIEVKFNENPLRKYSFDYNTGNRVSSSDYGGVYYSGSMTLLSITQVGADGQSTLRPMSFTYATKQTYLHDSQAVDYTGNPGNAAVFNWLHLTIIDGGYGGTVTYTYDENPDSPVSDIWTREVVTARTINPGIGPSEIYIYDYTGNPQYSENDGNEWDAGYRGFSQVKVTDSAGSYVIHYFNTVDENDGDQEKLTGLETRTEWYANDATLLQTTQLTWGWNNTEQAYSYVRQWGGWCPIGSFFNPQGIARDSDGFVYVVDTNNDRIQKFSSTGTFVTSWGSHGSDDSQFYWPSGIAIGNDGSIFVGDTYNGRVQQFDSNGNFLSKFGSKGTGNGQFVGWGTLTIAISTHGIYVCDSGANQVQIFDLNNHQLIGRFGTYGTGNGQFMDPSGIAIDASGYVYVADGGNNNRIQKFSYGGQYVTKWGSSGFGDGQFYGPRGVSVGSDGSIYVTDNMNCRVQVFTNGGTFLRKWGSWGSGDGQLFYPTGIAAGSDGNIYVADTNNLRVQKFTNSGDFVTKWGAGYRSTDNTLNHPRSLAVNQDGYVYIADCDNYCIKKFTDNGEFVSKWGTWGHGDGQFFGQFFVDVDSQGNVYVSDWGNSRIQKFDQNGSFIGWFGKGNLTTGWHSPGSGEYGVASTDNGGFVGPTGLAFDDQGNFYVDDYIQIIKFTNSGTYITKFGSQGSGDAQFDYSFGIAIDNSNNIYVSDSMNHRIIEFNSSGTFLGWFGKGNLTSGWHNPGSGEHGVAGSGNGEFSAPYGISFDADNHLFVADLGNDRIQDLTATGTIIFKWGSRGSDNGEFFQPSDVNCANDGFVFTVELENNRLQKFQRYYSITLDQQSTTIEDKTASVRYLYDGFGNLITEFHDGDVDVTSDEYTIWREYNPNESLNIINKPASERIYSTISEDERGPNLTGETLYYYDNNNTSNSTPPTKGNLTKVEQKKDSGSSISTINTYDPHGNVLTTQDPNGNTTTWTYEDTYNIYPLTKSEPITGLSESYTYDFGTPNLRTVTDVNGQVTTYGYDTFKRLTSVDYPLGRNPDVTYQYLEWGTINQQCVVTNTYYDATYYLFQTQFFDGLGRVVQVQSSGEANQTVISSTTAYNAEGQVDKSYVSQVYATNQISGYKAPEAGWKYTSYQYDGLGRTTQQTNADSTTVTHDYSTAWADFTTDERGCVTQDYFDAFNRLVQVKELFIPTVVTAAASSVSASSATLNGNLAGLGGAATATVSFEWGTTVNYGNTTSSQQLGSTGNFSANISGLSAGTTYHFRTKVVGNETAYGNDFTFTTPTAAPAANSNAASGIGTTSAVLNGCLTTFGSGTSVTVSFEWGLTTSYGNTTTGQQLSTVSNFYAFISGLSNNTTYHYRAKVVGSSTVYGTDRTLTTLSTSSNPVEINKTVATGADDGISDSSGGFYATSTNFEFGQPYAGIICNGWVRFTGITIPQGATIDQAYLTFVQSGFAAGTVLKITAENAANPSAPSSKADHASRTRLSTSVAWTSGYSDWWWHNTPDISSVIQALVNSYGYSSGAIQILIDDNGSSSGKEATSSTIEDTYAPRLYIRYHTNGGATQPPEVGSDAASNLSDTQATLNGTLASLGSASSVQVCFEYGTDLNYGGATTPQNLSSTGAFTASLSGLRPNTIYHVRAKAVGDATEYGADMVFRTSQTVGVCSTTTYAYDTLGNLTTVTDANGTQTQMTYNWLGWKTSMIDPNMGEWHYGYDSNGNLTSQTDAKSQQITFVYDAMNRLTTKHYPTGSGMTDVTYTYDATSGGNQGKGRLTGITDVAGTTSYTFDARGREITEKRTIDSVDYQTDFTYDGANRQTTITYPDTGSGRETVTNSYNGRGLPNGVSGSATGNTNLVGSTLYNQLGQITDINFNNGLKTTFGYYLSGTGYDTTGGYYGRLWEIKTLPQAGGTALLDLKYTWDAGGNVSTRQDVLNSTTENFSYDSLSRLTSVSGAYSNSYTYDAIGNITSMNGSSYTYGSSKPQAVTQVASTSYTYDSNGNMTARGPQQISWNVDNQPTSIGASQQSLSFNGTSSYVTVSSSAALKVGETAGSAATYEFWVKTTDTDENVFLDKGTIVPYISDGGWLTVDFYYNGGTSWYGNANTRINDGNWHYIVATTDCTVSKVYVDGTLKASHNITQLLVGSGSQALYIGKSSGGGYYTSGQLDEIRISSVARTQTEITNAWNSGNGALFSADGSTVALYHCDDGASPLTDATSNHFNGTLYNVTYTTGFPFSGGGSATFVYDANGQRVKKTENGQTILYVNQYYEKNMTTGIATTYYYLGGQLVAERENTTLRFMHQDSLGSTSLVTSSAGAKVSAESFLPFGGAWSGSVPTDEKFTGQKLDSTSLYYYNARYYDPTIGRFISADTVVQSLTNPQTLNRYSYVTNNPLRYIDPTGHREIDPDEPAGFSPLAPPVRPPDLGSDPGLPLVNSLVTINEPQQSFPDLDIDTGPATIGSDQSAEVGPAGFTYNQAAHLADQYGGQPSEYWNGTRTAPTVNNALGSDRKFVVLAVLGTVFFGSMYLESYIFGAVGLVAMDAAQPEGAILVAVAIPSHVVGAEMFNLCSSYLGWNFSVPDFLNP